MPDVLVFGTLIPKLFGAKVVLDLHDPMPGGQQMYLAHQWSRERERLVELSTGYLFKRRS
jgi:hypothetical protein